MTDESKNNDEKLSPLKREILKRWRRTQHVLSQQVKDELRIRFEGEVLFDEPMSRHTYIQVGGPADVYLKPASRQDILFAVRLARDHALPCHFHGAGANTLVRDGGIRGLVISLYDVLKNYEIRERTEDHVDIFAESGLSFHRLVQIAREGGAADLAPLAGIPGSVGGIIRMNAGTPVREIKDVVRAVTVLTPEGEEITLSREKLHFEYRDLKLPRTHLILGALFRLKDLMSPEEVAGMIKQYQARRLKTQPLEYPNLGSIFKNPRPVLQKAAAPTAGRLIEEAGLKGVRVGGARISTKHANFIINEGGASAKDVVTLINMIKDKVRQTSGVSLETEIKIIGEDREQNSA